MAKTKISMRKLIVCLVAGVIYIHVSNFMAHYYTEASLKQSPTMTNKILLEPFRALKNTILSDQSERTEKDSIEKFTEKSAFFIFFFSWPILVLCTLIYWIVIFIIFVVMLWAFVLSALLSIILWGLIYILSGFKIF